MGQLFSWLCGALFYFQWRIMAVVGVDLWGLYAILFLVLIRIVLESHPLHFLGTGCFLVNGEGPQSRDSRTCSVLLGFGSVSSDRDHLLCFARLPHAGGVPGVGGQWICTGCPGSTAHGQHGVCFWVSGGEQSAACPGSLLFGIDL